jgi:hypothetical protein
VASARVGAAAVIVGPSARRAEAVAVVGDLVYLLLALGCFALLTGFVALCDRIVGPPGDRAGSVVTEEESHVVR